MRKRRVALGSTPCRKQGIGLTPRQVEALGVVRALIEEKGYAPTIQEIAERLSLQSKSSAHRLLTALEERGHVVKGARIARSIALPPGRS